MQKLEKSDLKDLYAMRHLTLGECIEELKKHPTLSVLLTSAGIWFAFQIIFLLLIAGNVFYGVAHIFSLVMR